ncbi:hypothetical protein D4764_0263820, partial [Takifugu flavidus]
KRMLSKNPVEDQFEPGSGGEVSGDHRTTDENNQLAREQEEESLRGEAQFNLRSIGLQNRMTV